MDELVELVCGCHPAFAVEGLSGDGPSDARHAFEKGGEDVEEWNLLEDLEKNGVDRLRDSLHQNEFPLPSIGKEGEGKERLLEILASDAAGYKDGMQGDDHKLNHRPVRLVRG